MLTAAKAPVLARAGRDARDRLEILTALIDGPRFDPLFRDDIIEIPRDHPVLHWNCLIPGCDGQIHAQEMCRAHVEQWRLLEAAGADRLQFLRAAVPVHTKTWRKRPANCRVRDCGRPAQRSIRAGLCTPAQRREPQPPGQAASLPLQQPFPR